MKTIEEIIKWQSQCFDGRDISRLIPFMTGEQILALNSAYGEFDLSKYPQEEFTKENVLAYVARDLDFAFEKALNRRGISSGLMFEVMKMWAWVLDDWPSLINWPDENYAQYGLPLFKAFAQHYNLPNPIGEDEGNEYKYSSEAQHE